MLIYCYPLYLAKCRLLPFPYSVETTNDECNNLPTL